MLGIIFPTFRYEIQGLVGIGINFLGDATVRVFDIFSAIGIIMNQEYLWEQFNHILGCDQCPAL